MKKCRCQRTHEVPNFSGKGKKGKTCTQCLECGMYTFPCPNGHVVDRGFCINCGQYSPVLALRENIHIPTGTSSILVMNDPLIIGVTQ